MTKSTSNEETRRGQVGIGTLIVFIAMVLVAAIAAGVLINTAGFLQSQSEQTGQQSSEQVTDRVVVTETVGTISGSEIATIEMNVKRAPGAGPIDLSDATIHYVGPSNVNDVSPGDTGVSTTAVQGSSADVLEADSDVSKITLTLTDIAQNLGTGESATIDITTASGGTSTVTVEVPESLSGSAVRL